MSCYRHHANGNWSGKTSIHKCINQIINFNIIKIWISEQVQIEDFKLPNTLQLGNIPILFRSHEYNIEKENTAKRRKLFPKIIQYIGEKISKLEGDKRSEKRIKKYLKSEKTGSVYIFELNKKFDIDGNIKQNKARFINHSCNPNCEVDIIDNEIWISSIKKISPG